MFNGFSLSDAAVIAGVLFLLWQRIRPSTASPRPDSAPESLRSGTQIELERFAIRLAELETAVAGLPSLWATEVERVKEQADLARRSAARIEQANRRAEEIRARGDEEADDGSLAAPVYPGNGIGSREGFVSPLRQNVGPVSGWTPPHKARG